MKLVFQKILKEFIKRNKLLLKSEQRFRSTKHDLFTEKLARLY